jgi:hypothetical protein
VRATVGFLRFIALDEHDAPELLARMSKEQLPADGERYGIVSRLIARPGVQVEDLAVAAMEKLCRICRIDSRQLGALVLSSRIYEVEQAASEVVRRLELTCEPHGLERACSGFPAATELAAGLCARLQQPVALVTSEIISGSINWEPARGDVDDHHRARGQAAKQPDEPMLRRDLTWPQFVLACAEDHPGALRWFYRWTITRLIEPVDRLDGTIRYERLADDLRSLLEAEVDLSAAYHDPVDPAAWFGDDRIRDLATAWGQADRLRFGY